MKQFNFLLWLAFLSSPLFADFDANWKFDYREKESASLKGVTWLFAGHSSSNFDSKEFSKAGTLKALSIAKGRKIPSVGTSHTQGDESYFFTQSHVDVVAESYSGSHRLAFPQIKSVAFAGGNFSMCLCESFRDLVALSVKDNQTLNVTFLVDAVYDWKYSVQKALAGNFTREEAMKQDPYLLQALISPLSDEALFKFAKALLTENGEGFCPYQTMGPAPHVVEDYKLEFFRNGKSIGTVLNGKRKINVFFKTVEEWNGI